MSVERDLQTEWRLREAHAWPNSQLIHSTFQEQTLIDKSGLAAAHLNSFLLYEDRSGRDREPVPTTHLPAASAAPAYKDLSRERIVAVGAGAASVLALSYLVNRGVEPRNVTVIDPAGEYGGMWLQEWAQAGGINNPASLFYMHEVMDAGDRSADTMLRFLQRVARRHVGRAVMEKDTAVDFMLNRQGHKWQVETATGSHIEADSILLCPGSPKPVAIDGERIGSNLDRLPITVSSKDLQLERHQRTLTDEELRARRPLVLLGLGNSTATMLRQIQMYEDAHGVQLPYTIVTDRSKDAVNNPDSDMWGGDPIFRQPRKAYLAGYSGDLKDDRATYMRALQQGHIVAGVRRVDYVARKRSLRIALHDGEPVNVQAPLVFALLGYNRDDSLFKKLGAANARLNDNEYAPIIRPCDGAVCTEQDGYLSDVYSLGAAARSRKRSNVGVLPGIMAQIPEMTLTLAIRSYARHHPLSTAARKAWHSILR